MERELGRTSLVDIHATRVYQPEFVRTIPVGERKTKLAVRL